MAIEKKNWSVPDETIASLEILNATPRGPARSFAAMVLWTWFTQSAPGPTFCMANTRYRSRTHTISTKYHASFEITEPGGFGPSFLALLYTDGSVLVVRDSKDGSGIVQALPHTFRIKSSRKNPLLTLRATNPQRELYEASIELNALGRKEYVSTHTQSDVSENNRLWKHPALKAVRRDLRLLAPLFDTQTWIVKPTQGPHQSTPLSASDIALMGLPADAIGHLPYWPDFLPHQNVTDADRATAKKWMEDLASYAAHIYKQRPADVTYQVNLGFGGAPPIIYLRIQDRVSNHFVYRKLDDLFEASVDRPNLPIPQNRLTGVEFEIRNTRKHRAHESALTSGQARNIGNHEALSLHQRFGTLTPLHGS